MPFIPRILAALALMAALMGGLLACSSVPLDGAPTPAPEVAVAAQNSGGPKGSAATPRRPIVSRLPPHLDRSHPIADKRSIYFEMDSHVVPPEGVALLQLHGMYLAANPQLHLRLEGHTDELGGTEYNLALGQRRAEAVAAALRLLGVSDTQLEAVSFGEEKPRATAHDEDAWAENRRVDLIYSEP